MKNINRTITPKSVKLYTFKFIMLNILLCLIYLRMGPDRFRDRMFGRDPYPPPPPPPFLRDRMLSGGFGKVQNIDFICNNDY